MSALHLDRRIAEVCLGAFGNDKQHHGATSQWWHYHRRVEGEGGAGNKQSGVGC